MERLQAEKNVTSAAGKTFLYVGEWTVQAKTAAEAGIGIYEYDCQTGAIWYVDKVCTDLIAGQICVDPVRGMLYVSDEQVHSPAFRMQGGGGRVIAFSVSPETGALTQYGEEQPAFGTHTCYSAQDGTRRWLVAVNHGDKQAVTKTERGPDGVYRVVTDFSDVTAVLYPLTESGAILPASDVIQFPHDRCKMPPVAASLHSVHFAPDGERCIVTSIKHDQVFMLRLNRKAGKLETLGMLQCPEGNWPRYGVFHPEKKLFYINNEHVLQVNTVRYDDDGTMEIVQTLDSTPQLELDTAGERVMQSDFKVSRDGRFLFGLCRGTDTATTFVIGEDGLLQGAGSLKLDGKGPRAFDISPDGRFLLVSNLKSGTISTVAVARDGTLSLTGLKDCHMRYPGALCFYQAGQ